MSVKSAMLSGAKAVRQEFKQAGDIYFSVPRIAKTVAELAKAISEITNTDGQAIFEFEMEHPMWGTSVRVNTKSNRHNSVEFEFFNNNKHYTVYTPKIGSEYHRETRDLATEDDALEVLANWAGRNAADYTKELGEAIDSFEHKRSIENGEWNEGPTHL